jgi:hypothetical protein
MGMARPPADGLIVHGQRNLLWKELGAIEGGTRLRHFDSSGLLEWLERLRREQPEQREKKRKGRSRR